MILPDPPPPPTPIGLIAGGGRLPLLIAEGIAARGHAVHAMGLRGHYDPELPGLCAQFREGAVLRVGTWGPKLRRMGVRHAIMVGRVDKAAMAHRPLQRLRNRPDFKTAWVWYRHLRHDRRSSGVLLAVAHELSTHGVHLIDSTAPIPEHLATSGVMTSRRPNAVERADIDFGWPLLVEMLRLDVGQSMVVRQRDVMAVEAVEGTDRMIERAGQICRGKPWVLLKGARTGHDRRADVPTIGETTIQRVAESGGTCIALAAGDVIMVDKPQTIALAEKLGVAIVGVTEI